MPWELTGAAGLSFSDGNSDSLAYSLQFPGSYLKDPNEAYFSLDYFQAEDNGLESTNNLRYSKRPENHPENLEGINPDLGLRLTCIEPGRSSPRPQQAKDLRLWQTARFPRRQSGS